MVNSGMLDTIKFQNHDFVSCFMWVCHKLREEYRLRVLENRMLRNLFGHKKKEGTVGLSKLDNEKLHYLHPSPNI